MTDRPASPRAWLDDEGRPHVAYWSNDHDSVMRAWEIGMLPKPQRAAATRQWFDEVSAQQQPAQH